MALDPGDFIGFLKNIGLVHMEKRVAEDASTAVENSGEKGENNVTGSKPLFA